LISLIFLHFDHVFYDYNEFSPLSRATQIFSWWLGCWQISPGKLFAAKVHQTTPMSAGKVHLCCREMVAAHPPVNLECAVRGVMRLDVTGMVGIQGWGDVAP